MRVVSYEQTLRELAELDWVVAPTGRGVLHHIAESEPDEDEWRFDNVVTSCDRKMTAAYIPGLFTRMGAKRCDRCCDRVGYPRGIGSPKNDDACRPLMKARIKAARP